MRVAEGYRACNGGGGSEELIRWHRGIMGAVNERIVPMDETDDFEVADGDPDVRGWQVIASDGERVGEVDELLIDVEELRVRYLDVLLDSGDDARDERHVLIPVGHARLHERDDRILVDGLDRAAMLSLPRYAQEPLTHEFERRATAPFQPGPLDATAATRELERAFDDEKFYETRRPPRGD